jgi:tetratricopeptide (TPR) repeat protein
LAKPGEILVSPDTYCQSEGHFSFEDFGLTQVRGKVEPVQVYRVQSVKESPVTTHRPSGFRSDLIGRNVELSQLEEGVQRLRAGESTVFSICGDAGTGKSRLVEEFRATLDLQEIQWREGHAYAYSQNTPYFMLIDLLNRAWQVEEGDPPQKVREKVESGIEQLLGKKEDVAPYIGSLWSLSYPEIESVSPQFWKTRLHDGVQAILAALAHRAPAVICLEDIHWADPSSVELFRYILSDLKYPAIFLCIYRPPFGLFTSHQISALGKLYREIRLQDLSTSETQDMLQSLLKTGAIPPDLEKFIQQKVEGNPFYLEEVINSLIESQTLSRDNGSWRLTRPISESDIPPTVNGVISARLDHLETDMKRILQEASVIGRAFPYEILRAITGLKECLDRCLNGLERIDLIRTRSFQPEMDYVFKHALTQEVAYNGLLKKERREIHERVALVIEQLPRERLSEFYETLAFHFKQGQSSDKAIDYLVKSGEKSLNRYALEESHQYFEEAFDILVNKPDKTKEEEGLLIDIIIKWAFVFYYRAAFRDMIDLFNAYKDLAESLDDKARLGMFYGWLGFAMWARGKAKDSYEYLCKALEIGEEIEDQQVIGYACTWLTWTCLELDLLDKAITFGERAQKIYKSHESDQYIYFKSLCGLGLAYCYKGESKKCFEAGKALLEYGQNHANIRSLVTGHSIVGGGHFSAGDFPSTIESLKRAIQVRADPIYCQTARMYLGLSYFINDQLLEAEEAFKEVEAFSRDFGTEWVGTPAQAFLGIIFIAKGQMNQGLRMVEDAQREFVENGRKWFLALSHYAMGKLYLQIVEGSSKVSFSVALKNIGFLVKNVPFAKQKAAVNLNKTIEIAQEIGAKSLLGMAYLDLGLLHKAKGEKDKARECITTAMQFFEQCEAEVFLQQAKEALESL